MIRKTKGTDLMKYMLIIAGITVIAAVNFIMYCCLIIASREDRILEKLNRRSNPEGYDD
jgi:hypothetical protein